MGERDWELDAPDTLEAGRVLADEGDEGVPFKRGAGERGEPRRRATSARGGPRRDPPHGLRLMADAAKAPAWREE